MTLENLKTGRRREESYGVRTQEGDEQEKDQGSSDCSGYAEKSSEELEGPPETESMSNLGHNLEILEEDINDQKDHFFGGSSSVLPARHLPAATKILSFLEEQGPLQDTEVQNDWASTKYTRNASRCFSKVQKAQIRKYEALMKEATRGRKFFLPDGERFGLGPKSTREPDGELYDQIWVIEGASVPFILRETDTSGCYKIISEAYVQGFMYRELIGSLVGPPRRISLV